MRTITLIGVLALVGLASQAEARDRTVPRDPGIFKRMFNRGHPSYVQQAFRQAKRADSKQQADRILRSALSTGLKRGDLSVYSAIRLAKKTQNHGAHNSILKTFYRVNRSALSSKQVIRLAKAATRGGSHNGILSNFKRYTAAHGGSAKTLKRLDGARYVPSASSGSSSSSSDDGYGGVSIGINPRGGVEPVINMGGMGVSPSGNVYINTGAGVSIGTGMDLW
jgi:hypothetical protein